MFYPTTSDKVADQLKLRLEALNIERAGFQFLLNSLKEYGDKAINKRFKDFLEAKSPLYSVNYSDYNRETHKEETTTKKFPVYSLSINTQGYFKSINLYNNKLRDYNGIESNETFSIYGNNNAETEEEKEESKNLNYKNLLPVISSRLEGINETIDKIEKDLSNIETITAKYNAMRQELEDIEEAIHYYTRDKLTGKNDYNISKR